MPATQQLLSIFRLMSIGGMLVSVSAIAHEIDKQPAHPGAQPPLLVLAAQDETKSPASGAAILKFHELYKLPIGARGLEPAEKLLSLAGRQVRMLGYMARQETPTSEFFILSPLPVSLSDEDESLADDLPASVVFVHVDLPDDRPLPYSPGLLQVTGRLEIGAVEESDGHVSSIRLQLDRKSSQAMAAIPHADP